MSINPLSSNANTANTNQTGAATSGTSGSAGSQGNQLNVNPASQLGESAFLTLLSAQLKYQNPLQPMDNTQFVAELAQFSQLSAVTTQTSTLQQILQAVQNNSSSLIGASQLIGKVVTTQAGTSGQVTAVSQTSNGLTFDVSGIGTVQASAITQVSQS